MREWYLFLIGCCKATTVCNQGSSGGSTTQQSVPIRLGSLVNREASTLHFKWQFKKYSYDFLFNCFVFFLDRKCIFFTHSLGVPLVVSINCNTSRTLPPERALSFAKKCSLVHLLPLRRSTVTLEIPMVYFLDWNSTLWVSFTTKTLLNYHN